MKFKLFVSVVSSLLVTYSLVYAQTITIATVNNADMIRMQKLSENFTKKNPGIKLKWITLTENILRQRVTNDIVTKGGQYDILTIGTYEVQIWAKRGWLAPLDGLSALYDVDDLLPTVRKGLTVDNKLYAAPFYGESSMVMYRKDLMQKAGLTMPKEPTWEFIAKAAKKMTDKEKGVYGVCLRGKAGWGENIAFLTATANSFGAKWFDMNWNPQFDSKEWKETLNFYIDLMKEAAPQDSFKNGFNENLALFQTGKCAIWVDATVAASFVTDPKNSQVHDKVGFTLAPDTGLGKRGNWLWIWSLAISNDSKKIVAAKKFIEWSTSKEYLNMVAQKEGWANVPPGTRTSLYKNPKYLKSAAFAQITLDSINSADPTNPTVDKVPYVGIQFVAIPEFQEIATKVAQQFSAALVGTISIDRALENSQKLTKRAMIRAGYIK